MAGSLGNLAQHLGPLAIGTQKETNPGATTTAGQIRNMGVSDGYQFGTITFASTTVNSNLTYTQTNASSPVGTVILPAGAYIETINIDVTTAFNAATTNQIVVALSPTSAAAGTNLVTLGNTTSIPVGRFSLGIVATATYAQLNTAYWVNVSNGQTAPTDQFVEAWYVQTGTAATTGVATISVGYVVRFPDGSWYKQSPQSPILSTTILPLGTI